MTDSTLRSDTSSIRERRARTYSLTVVASIVVAAAVNLGLYAIGRATDAALRIDPGAGPANHLVVPGDVAWKTLAPLAVGALVLALIGSRSRRWMTIVLVVGVVGAIATAPVAVIHAHDLTTGLLLGGMHTVCALAYLVIGLRARAMGHDVRRR